jgi:AraC family transcriptional regulator, transcriptional activator of pobA
MIHFKTIAELDLVDVISAPEHPLFSLNRIQHSSNTMKSMEITCDFYIVCLKRLKSGVILYGKTKYDHDRGSMFFMRPRQILTFQDVRLKDVGFAIHVHEDFLMGRPLFADIKKYGYFDYETNEALQLSPREEEVMWSLFRKMETEYHDHPDEFSRPIILSHLDSMLRYAQRFYKRQFIDRQPLSGATVTCFDECLNTLFDNSEAGIAGLPSVNHMAEQLHLSPKYLSDLLKQETGTTALELIHLHVISQAKNLLIAGNLTVSEIAYQLGFENPPYFSRLFKKEVGISPKEFKNRFLN